MESTKATLRSLGNRDRSPSVREKPRLTLSNRPNTSDNLVSYGSLGRSPTSPTMEFKPKSILKKSNSNIESSSLGYVNEELNPSPKSDSSPTVDDIEPPGGSFLKPPLHHSLSYTPGFHYEPNTAL